MSHSRVFRVPGHSRLLYEMYLAKVKNQTSFKDFMEIVGKHGVKLIYLFFFQTGGNVVDGLLSERAAGISRRRKKKRLIVPQFKIGKQRLSPNQLSEGTFKTLALLFHIVTTDSTALLIES